MKYKIEMMGWEYHIQTKSLNGEQVEKIAVFGPLRQSIYELEHDHLSGEGDFEICALDNSGNGPLTITVYDEDQNVVLEIGASDVLHYSEIDELCNKDWDKDLEINPEYSEDYENTLYLEKDYSGSVFYYEVESAEIPKKEDFLISYLCIATPNGDIDLIGELIFKSNILIGDLESGKHKGTYMNIYTSEGKTLEIEN
jgi:hypothetical protein